MLYAILLVVWELLIENEGHRTGILIIGTNADNQLVDDVYLLGFQRFKHMVPSEGEQTSIVAMLKGFRKIRHAQPQRYNLIFLVLHQRYKIEVQDAELEIGNILHLLDGRRLIIIQNGVAF